MCIVPIDEKFPRKCDPRKVAGINGKSFEGVSIIFLQGISGSVPVEIFL